MEIRIHNECTHPTAEEFLAGGFVDAAARSLASHLGRLPSGPVHVVLSDRPTHEQRFPPRAGEVLELEDLSEIPEDQREELAQRYAWSSYAHGVTTHAAAWQDPPAEVADGDLILYLDVESIESLSQELDVLFEGLLGRVAVHELSHAVRGHATEHGRATHGWFREGDAQRDAWHVLTDLLMDPPWAAVARWARAAQVRLADRQPSAYRWFECDWVERSRLAGEAPQDPPNAWISQPPRAVFVLARGGLVEVPVADAAHRILGAPSVGDKVYLGDGSMVAGPWVVVASRNESRGRHPRDQTAIERYAKELRVKPSIMWLSLRQERGMFAALKSDVRRGSTLSARKLERREVAQLEMQLTEPAERLVETVARREIEGREASAAEIAEMLKTAGQPVPEGLFREIDPFNDWG